MTHVLIECGKAKGTEGPPETKALLQAVACPLPLSVARAPPGAHLRPGRWSQWLPVSGSWMPLRGLRPKVSQTGPRSFHTQTLTLGFVLECGVPARDPRLPRLPSHLAAHLSLGSNPLPGLLAAPPPLHTQLWESPPVVPRHDLTQSPEGLPSTFHWLGGLSVQAPAGPGQSWCAAWWWWWWGVLARQGWTACWGVGGFGSFPVAPGPLWELLAVIRPRGQARRWRSRPHGEGLPRRPLLVLALNPVPAADPPGASPSAAVVSPWPWQPPGTRALLVRLTRQACWAEAGVVGSRGRAAPGLRLASPPATGLEQGPQGIRGPLPGAGGWGPRGLGPGPQGGLLGSAGCAGGWWVGPVTRWGE